MAEAGQETVSDLGQDRSLVEELVGQLLAGVASVSVADYLPLPEYPTGQDAQRRYWSEQTVVRSRRRRVCHEVKQIMRYKHARLVRVVATKLVLVPMELVTEVVTKSGQSSIRTAIKRLSAGHDYEGFTKGNLVNAVVDTLEEQIALLEGPS